MKTASIFLSLTTGLQSEGNLPARSYIINDRIKTWFTRLFPARQKQFTAPLLDETGLRITVMHGEEILAEYDLSDKCWIHTDHHQDSISWQKTLATFRKHAGFERDTIASSGSDDIFLIADLHLGHANIIQYCSRPFLARDVAEMDRVLIGNWNSVIAPETQVYHVGDLRYGRDALPFRNYRRQLNGVVTFITGNHDEREEGAILSRTIDFEGEQFLLVHDPSEAPFSFNGWVIHGHHHNNDLRSYPFICFEKRRINISAEVIGYVPVSIRDLCAVIRYHRDQGNTRAVLFNYPYVE